MAKTGIVHHVGTFLLFASAVLLLIATISAPVVNDLGMLKVTLSNSSTVSFGTFGNCILNVGSDNNDKDYCTKKVIGYNPEAIMQQVDGVTFGDLSTDTSEALTRVMILHPVACGLAFIAFLLALGAGFCGALFASMVSAVTFLITLVVMACDFALFGIVKNRVNHDGTGSHAYYSVGMWCVLAAMIALFLATFVVLFSCCSARRHAHDNRTSKSEMGYAGNGTTTTTKRHFWQRRSNY